MHKIRIGGVPEHFNYPWHYAIEQGFFKEANIDLEWIDFPGGTGAMANALKKNELDMALLLTEGAVKEIIADAPFKIAFPYVETPLVWGIHTSAKNTKANLQALSKMRYAVSRLGSGSHLMAYVHAKTQNIALNTDQMITIGDLQGARTSLLKEETDLFFWERFMTKPYVDNGELKLLGQFPTPWPCFVWVAAQEYVNKNEYTLLVVREILDKALEKLYQNVNFTEMIARRYELPYVDVKSWLSTTRWASKKQILASNLQQVIHSLGEIGMTVGNPSVNSLIYPTVSLI